LHPHPDWEFNLLFLELVGDVMYGLFTVIHVATNRTQAVRYMLGKWSKNRNPELNDAWIDAKTELLEELAYQFSCDGKEIFTLRELRQTIDEYLRSGNASTDFDNLNPSQLIAELSEQDGILQKLHKDGDQYLFMHRTFQEYLTACYLNRSKDGIALAREHFWEYDWHETLSLLAGLMKNPVPLLQSITAQKDDIFSTLLLLAGRCIAECQENSHPLMVGIIDRIYNLWQSYPNAGFIKSIIVALGHVNSQMFQRLQKAFNDVLNDKDNFKHYLLDVLAEIGSSQAVETLYSASNHEDFHVSSRANWDLFAIKNPEKFEALNSDFNESYKDSDVKRQVSEDLDGTGNFKTVEALISELNHENCYVRSWAAEDLGKMGNPQAVKPLISALNDEDEYVRRKAAEALGKIGSPQAVEALTSALNDEDGYVKEYAVEALGRIGIYKAVQALVSTLNHEDFNIRCRAAVNLGEMGNFEAVEPLIFALNHMDFEVRYRAVLVLGKMGNSKAVEALIFALNHQDLEVRWQAARALGEIGNVETLKKLIQLPEIDIYRGDIFPLARTLAIRFSKEKLPFIPVYPELVAHKQ